MITYCRFLITETDYFFEKYQINNELRMEVWNYLKPLFLWNKNLKDNFSFLQTDFFDYNILKHHIIDCATFIAILNPSNSVFNQRRQFLYF